MRRLTLILSDLFLPEESVVGAVPQTHELPALDWLLRFADVQRIGDWRHWLLARAGGANSHLRLGTLASRTVSPGVAAYDPWMDSAWIATPVHLEARLDHARLVDGGLIRLDEAERARWCEEFGRVFGPTYTLRECGERAFVLTGLGPVEVGTADPARLLGAEIGPALPGAEAPELRRLWTEIEMWLHGSQSNEARERSRRRRITALWLWGNEHGPRSELKLSPTDTAFLGEDPIIRGLACGEGQEIKASSFSELPVRQAQAFVEFAPLTGGEPESLPELEKNWFAPARRALGDGRLEYVQVIANDRLFTVRPRAGLKFWRPRHGWLESLA
jgi:hypothetical protein